MKIKNFHILKDLPRPFTKEIRKHFGMKELIGLEVGVFTGDNLFNMIKELNIKRIYAIDLIKRININNKIVFIEKDSVEAAENIRGELDFVYIDAEHYNNRCYKDLKAYYPLIKTGGIMGGHDIDQVCQDVVRFAKEHDLDLRISFLDWWFVKK